MALIPPAVDDAQLFFALDRVLDVALGRFYKPAMETTWGTIGGTVG